MSLALAERLAAACAVLLGDPLVAVYLHGSLTLGGYRPGRIDVDVLVVVERPLEEGELAALRALVERLGEDVAVDLRVVTREAAGRPARAPALELGVEVRRGRPLELRTHVAEPDLVAELAVVRAFGRSLVGPAPEAVVGPVPDEWVIAYGDELLARWQRLTDDAEHAELMVLTACRIWRFAAEGVLCAKHDAGRWALACDGSLAAVRAALRQRQGEPGVDVDRDEIARLFARVREAARRSLSGDRESDCS